MRQASRNSLNADSNIKNFHRSRASDFITIEYIWGPVLVPPPACQEQTSALVAAYSLPKHTAAVVVVAAAAAAASITLIVNCVIITADSELCHLDTCSFPQAPSVLSTTRHDCHLSILNVGRPKGRRICKAVTEKIGTCRPTNGPMKNGILYNI